MRGATGITLQPHQMLQLPRKIAIQNQRKICRKQLKRQFQCATDLSMIRARSEHDPSMNWSSRTRPFAQVTFRASETHFVLKITTFRAPAIYPDLNFQRILCLPRKVTLQHHQMLRLPRKVTLRHHQILRLPRKMILMIDHWSSWHMKRHLQCGEQQASPSNLTKSCACHAKLHSKNLPKTVEASIPMRDRSEHDPSMIRTWTRHLAPARSPRLLFALRRRILYWKLQHFPLRLSTQISPNTVPATKKWHSNITKCCACHEKWHSDITKYCSCHAKWLSWLMSVAFETSFTMRGTPGITFQPHQILCLPRKIAFQNQRKICRKQLKRQFQCATDPNPIRTRSDHELVISHPPVRPGYFSRFGDAFCIENYNISRSGYLPRFKFSKNTVPATKSDTPTSPNAAPATKSDTPTSPKYCACHAKWFSWINWCPSHLKRHLQCAEHQASLSNLTKYCACHAKLHSKIKEKFAENSWRFNSNARPIRTQSEPDPNPIRPWTRHLAPARSPRLHFALWRRILYWKLQHFPLRLSTQISPNTVPATKSDTPTSPNAAPATKSDTPRSPNIAPGAKCHTRSFCWTELLQICYWTKLLLNCDWTVTELSCYWAVTELSCYWAVTELSCYWTVRELSCYLTVTELICYWTVTELSCCCYWTKLLLSCYWTELLLLLKWAVTELLLNWAVTELLVNWAVTELFVNWAVPELSCYWTELLLNCYWTELLLLLN